MKKRCNLRLRYSHLTLCVLVWLLSSLAWMGISSEYNSNRSESPTNVGVASYQQSNSQQKLEFFHLRDVLTINELLPDRDAWGSALKSTIPPRLLSPWENERRQRYRPNCSALIAGDRKEVALIKKRLKKDPYIPASSYAVSQWASNCTQYRRHYQRRVWHVTHDERTFPIAFSLRMHRGVEFVEQLLRNIYSPHNLYCIYVDDNADITVLLAMQKLATCFNNVFIASKLRPFYYSSVTHIKADIRCMKDSIVADSRWKYFINLAGEEFPSKSAHELTQLLRELRGRNGIQSYLMTVEEKFHRLKDVYEVRHGKNVETEQKRIQFPDIDFYKGEEYSLFSRAFVEWALTHKVARDLLEFCSNGTWGCDEIFWATLHQHPGAPGGTHSDRLNQAIDTRRPFAKARIWIPEGTISSTGSLKGGRCKSNNTIHHMCILSVSELPWLRSQPQPFANKFHFNEDPIVTDCLSDYLDAKSTWHKLASVS